MNPKYRMGLLFAVLAGVAALAWFAPEPADQRVVPPAGKAATKDGSPNAATAGPKSSQTNPAKQGASEVSIAPTLPQRDALGRLKQELFGFQTWQPPPPPPPKAVPPPPPPPPVAPPNPYRFAGRVLQDGQTQVFLTRGEYPLPIKVGDVLDGSYRIDAISSSAVSMTYLPLSLPDRVAIPTSTEAASGPVVAPGASVPATARPLVLSPTPPVPAVPPAPRPVP